MSLLRPIAFAAALFWAAPCIAATYYVAGNGSGTTCSLEDPCQYITVALVFANANDTIVCLSAPPTESLTITKSLTIDCTAGRGGVRGSGNSGSNGSTVSIIINVTGTYSNTAPPARTDSLRTVRLRGLNIDGASSSGRTYDRGIEIQSAAVVHIEDCTIQNYKQQGIYDHRAGGQTKLFVKDSIISGNGGPGIIAASQAVGITVLDNVSLLNNSYGLAAASGNNVAMNRSVVSGNTSAGVEADGGAHVNVNDSMLSHNAVHIQSFGTIRLKENTLQFGNTALQGPTISMGGNRFSGNGSLGMSPTPASNAPADVLN